MEPTYLGAKGSSHNHGKHSKGLDSKDLGSKKASGNLETWQVIRCIKWDASCFLLESSWVSWINYPNSPSPTYKGMSKLLQSNNAIGKVHQTSLVLLVLLSMQLNLLISH